jgi:hypothetical protein
MNDRGITVGAGRTLPAKEFREGAKRVREERGVFA